MERDPIRCRAVMQERTPADQQNVERCRKLMEKERARMKEVWERLRKKQTALLEAREKLSKLMTKGTTDIWKIKNAMAEQLKEYERMIAAAATEDDQAREARERMIKEQEQAMKGERPRAGRDTPSTACQGCGRQECRSNDRPHRHLRGSNASRGSRVEPIDPQKQRRSHLVWSIEDWSGGDRVSDATTLQRFQDGEAAEHRWSDVFVPPVAY